MASVIDNEYNLWVGKTYDRLFKVDYLSNVDKVSMYSSSYFAIQVDGRLEVIFTYLYKPDVIDDDTNFVDLILTSENIYGIDANSNIRWWERTVRDGMPTIFNEKFLELQAHIIRIKKSGLRALAISEEGNIYQLPSLEQIYDSGTGIIARDIVINSHTTIILDVNGDVYLKGIAECLGLGYHWDDFTLIRGLENIKQILLFSSSHTHDIFSNNVEILLALDEQGRVYFSGTANHDLFGIQTERMRRRKRFYGITNLVDIFGSIEAISGETSVGLRNHEGQLWTSSNFGLFEQNKLVPPILRLLNEPVILQDGPPIKSARKF